MSFFTFPDDITCENAKAIIQVYSLASKHFIIEWDSVESVVYVNSTKFTEIKIMLKTGSCIALLKENCNIRVEALYNAIRKLWIASKSPPVYDDLPMYPPTIVKSSKKKTRS